MEKGTGRYDYDRDELREESVPTDPFQLLRTWIDAAKSAGVVEPTAMTLATVSSKNEPSARVVLLRGLDDRGLVFYSNFKSRKGQELSHNPNAAAVFWWGALERQVRVEGIVEVVASEEADAYFSSRPLGSQISAHASPQSQVLESREQLEELFEKAAQELGQIVPRPEWWGGYRLVPKSFEFWQGRPSRLHDRILYSKAERDWLLSRLAP